MEIQSALALAAPLGSGPHACGFIRGNMPADPPDNDDSGRNHAEQVAQSLIGIASLIRILELPGLEIKGDIVDWQKQHTREELDALVEQAPEWQPQEPPTETPSQIHSEIWRRTSPLRRSAHHDF